MMFSLNCRRTAMQTALLNLIVLTIWYSLKDDGAINVVVKGLDDGPVQ
jgi:hypothetical protein